MLCVIRRYYAIALPSAAIANSVRRRTLAMLLQVLKRNGVDAMSQGHEAYICHTADDVARIEEFIHDLKNVSGPPSDPMLEHLEAARFYLLGAMPQEYQLSLNLVEEVLPDIPNEDLRKRIANFVRSQQTGQASD
jgi:hypothetical protein